MSNHFQGNGYQTQKSLKSRIILQLQTTKSCIKVKKMTSILNAIP